MARSGWCARRVAWICALAGALAGALALLVLAVLLPALGLKAWNSMVCLGLLRSGHDGAYALRVENFAM